MYSLGASRSFLIYILLFTDQKKKRLEMMVFMVSRVKQCFWKDFKGMEQDLESFGLRLKFWLWKGEKDDDEMSKMLQKDRYLLRNSRKPPRDKKPRTHHLRESTQAIRSHELTT